MGSACCRNTTRIASAIDTITLPRNSNRTIVSAVDDKNLILCSGKNTSWPTEAMLALKAIPLTTVIAEIQALLYF